MGLSFKKEERRVPWRQALKIKLKLIGADAIELISKVKAVKKVLTKSQKQGNDGLPTKRTCNIEK